MWKLVKISINDADTTGNLLNYSYHQSYYKFNGIDLSTLANTATSQQINFIGKLEERTWHSNVFITEKQQKKYSKLFFTFIKRDRII